MSRRGAVPRELSWLLAGGTLSGLSDRQLIGRFVEHAGTDAAEAAITAIVERHGPMVRQVCSRVLRDPGDVPDAVQATFLVLARKAGSVRKLDALPSWLHGVALRVARSMNDARSVRVRHERALGLGLSTCYEPPDDTERAELFAALHDEVERLPDRFRSAVVLCDLEGLTDEEAAGRVGCPVGTIKSRLATARRRLRDRLHRRGLAPDTAFAVIVPGPRAWPTQLTRDTVRTALNWASVTVAEAPAVSVAEGVIQAMTWKSMISWFSGALAALTLAAGAGGAAWAYRPVALAQTPVPAPVQNGAASASSKVIRKLNAETRERVLSAIEQARTAAEAIDNLLSKGRALAGVAALQIQLGDREGGEATFRRAAESLVNRPRQEPPGPDPKLQADIELALARFTAGDRAQGEEIARRFLKEIDEAKPGDAGANDRRLLLTDFSWRLAHVGIGPLAREVVGHVDPPHSRMFNMARVGQFLAREGQTNEAIKALDEAEPMAVALEKASAGPGFIAEMTPYVMSESLADLAAALGKAGKLEEGKTRADRAQFWAERTPIAWKPQCYARMAMARRRLGDEDAARQGFAEAIRLVDEHSPPREVSRQDVVQARYDRWTSPVEQLGWTAMAQIDSGDRDGALATLKKAREIWIDRREQSGEYEARLIGRALANAGEAEKALEFVQEASLIGTNQYDLELLGRTQATEGRDREAMNWATQRKEPVERANALLGIVRGILARAEKL